MESSNNALWIGAIVIVAALTVVELMSSRDKLGDADTAELTGGDTVSGSAAPVSPQFDAGKIAMGTADSTGTLETTHDSREPAPEEAIESDIQFDTESEFASDLIIDLDSPEAEAEAEAHTATMTQNLQSELEANAAENTEDIRPVDLSADEVQSAETEHAAAAPVETTTQSTGEVMADKSALIEATDDSAPVLSETGETHDHSAEASIIAQHLAAAEEAIKAFRMTTPAGDNAYEHYQAVLTIDPDNTEAHAGIEKIVDMYIYLIDKAIAEERINRAKVYLQRAEYISPGSPKLKNLHAKLD